MITEPDSNVFAVILAGGSGSRFWPKSRQKWPKQLCRLGGSQQSMIELTLSRLDGFIPPNRRLIVTHKDQAEATRRIVGDHCLTVLAEPESRNTANALALAALQISKMTNNKDPIVISLHADHIIANVDEMKRSILAAIDVAKSGELCLLGVVPDHAETGYGYIEKGTAKGKFGVFKVASFVEKPDLETAESYVTSKKYFWNAGLFVFPVKVLLSEIEARLPMTVRGLKNLLGQNQSFDQVDSDALSKVYSELPKISIDHAVLEVSRKVSVVEANIGWQDVGSWDALAKCFKTDASGNFVQGDAMLLDSVGCTVDTDGPFTVLFGLKDMVVVHSGGAILVCPKNRSQDVKIIVDQLKDVGRSDLV